MKFVLCRCRLVVKGTGDAVIGGTVAYEAPVTLRASSTGSASTLAGIARYWQHEPFYVNPL
jgi:cation transport ATPase